MKKSVIIAILGVAASVATSYGQGYIAFDSYIANSFASANTYNFGTTTPVADSTYNAALFYAIGTVSDPVTESLLSSVISDPTGMTAFSGTITGAQPYPTPISGGVFGGPGLTIPGYSGGAITFEVIAYNGSSYDNSTSRGRSGSFTMNSIRTDGIDSAFGDNGAPMPNFVVGSVTPVPEPTTLALAGLGGLASLVAFRRKQA